MEEEEQSGEDDLPRAPTVFGSVGAGAAVWGWRMAMTDVVVVDGDGVVETWVETAVELRLAGVTAGVWLAGLGVPGHGTVVTAGAARLRYRPQRGFAGIDGFAYRLADAAGDRPPGRIAVQVRRPNRQPVAADGVAVIGRDAPVTLDVLAAASDPDGDPLRLSVLELPAFGRLEVGADQALTYWPDATPGVVEDGFAYRLTDDRGGTAEARVRLVTPPPPPPAPPPLVARDDRVTTARDTPVRIAILANDDETPTRRLAALTLPRNGHVEPHADLAVTYTPAPGFTGIDDFTYRLVDESGQQSGAVVIVQVVEP